MLVKGATELNSSPPSAAYMRRWSGSAFVQVMDFRLFGAMPLFEPKLVHCNWIISNKLQWNSNPNTKFVVHEVAIENVFCEMGAILYRQAGLNRQMCCSCDKTGWMAASPSMISVKTVPFRLGLFLTWYMTATLCKVTASDHPGRIVGFYNTRSQTKARTKLSRLPELISCTTLINTLRPRQDGRHFPDDTSKWISWMKMYKFWLRFHWSLFPMIQLIIFQHWFR